MTKLTNRVVFALAALLALASSAVAQTPTNTSTPTQTPTSTPTRQTVVLNSVPCGASPYAEMTPSTVTAPSDGKFSNPAGNSKLLVRNGTGGAVVVQVVSTVDSFSGRTGDIGNGSSTVSIGAGELYQFGPFQKRGWNQSDNYVLFNVDTTDADLLFYAVKDSCP